MHYMLCMLSHPSCFAAAPHHKEHDMTQVMLREKCYLTDRGLVKQSTSFLNEMTNQFLLRQTQDLQHIEYRCS
jgi:hypothetical protein